jgi:protein tyrosine phosphatase (PTP) superfamily phosphohydrolase (DUF442 family)
LINEIYNYMQLNEFLFCSGMPTVQQIPSFSENGVQVVINLATSKSEGAVPNEKELVESQGIEYHNIPVDWAKPTMENLNNFFNIMDAHKESKVFVHCQANYRATAFITLYRILRLGWDREEAFVDLNKIWTPEEYPIWEDFIERNLSQNDR